MPEPWPERFIAKPIRTSAGAKPGGFNTGDDKVPCERCGAEMFRMQAVWRCPNCRFKTDRCGW